MKVHLNPRKLIRDTWRQLRELREHPRVVSGGLALGIFWGFTPLTGLKTLLSLGTAWLFGRSKLAAVLASTLHDVLLPVWPVVLRWEYQVGYWLLHRPHVLPPPLTRSELKLAELFQWKTLAVLWPTFLGSCVIGGPIALALYWVMVRALGRYKAHHAAPAA